MSGLVRAGEPLLVMLSGGADSVCLLDVALSLGADVTALHVNYGLREEAAADEWHCASVCSSLKVELIVEAVSLSGVGNMQAEARSRRYALAERHAVGDYAAAHTASDQAETVLYRLAASQGRRALLGMEPRRGRLVRPLLGVTRAETEDWCRARGLEWRVDSSNADRKFARARVRHDVLAALREINPAAELNIARTAEELRDETDVLDAAAAKAEGAPGAAIPLFELRKTGPGIARLVLRRAAEREGIALSRADADTILSVDEHGSRSFDVGDGGRALVEYGTVRFTRLGTPVANEPVLLGVPGSVDWGDWTVTARVGGAGEEFVSPSALGDVVTVRGWRDGDRISPAGMGGSSKTLADVFGDAKVPREMRRTLPLVETADGTIAWVAGVVVAEGFRAEPGAEGVIALSARPRSK